MLAYVHPIAGGAAIVLLAYVASLGLRARTDRRARGRLLAQHDRLSTPTYVIVLILWASGIASANWLRTDLPETASFHFRIGTVMTGLLSGSFVTARWMQRGRPQWRDIHPWLGAAAVLLAAAQVVTGLQIMP